jgi:hypothetical protein
VFLSILVPDPDFQGFNAFSLARNLSSKNSFHFAAALSAAVSLLPTET